MKITLGRMLAFLSAGGVILGPLWRCQQHAGALSMTGLSIVRVQAAGPVYFLILLYKDTTVAATHNIV